MNTIYWNKNIEVKNNRYFKIYLNLIDKSKNRILLENDYFEKHHIIPKCMNGLDNIDNLINLTAKEHYIAHRLLIKFTIGIYQYKMMYALDAMGMKSKHTKNRFRMPSRVYQYNKQQISEHGHTDETKIKIGLSNKGRIPSNKGKPRSIETKKKIRNSHIGREYPAASAFVKETTRKTHTGRKRSSDTKQKQRNSKLGNKNPMYGKNRSDDFKNL